MRNLLVINTGSSSIKFSIFEKSKDPRLLISGRCEGINAKNSYFIFKDKQRNSHNIKIKISNYKDAINIILNLIKNQEIEFNAIAHRVVHGGNLNKTILINNKVESIIENYSKFAPLHNPQELQVIRILKKEKKPQYAVFDTEFFSNIPEVSKTYPIQLQLTKKYNIRKYGFQGISHEYVSKNIKGKTITCHLGSGCSISAIKDNKVLDTSMGLTPLEGIMMRTRSGNIDLGIIFFLQKKGYNIEEILSKKSGFFGISGKKDFRDILKSINKEKNSKLAYDMFVYSILKKIGSYIAILNGLDNLIFTAAIGENVPKLRKDICNNLKFLNLKIDENKNNKNSELISDKNSKVKVYVKKTNEEYLIAKKVFEKW
jgi:acetate kinase